MAKQSKQERLAELSARAALTEEDCREISSMGNAREISFAPGVTLPDAAFALPGKATKFLTITASNVSPRHLADLARWPVLERLVLQDCRLEDEQSLAALTGAPRLKGLWLNGCNVTDAALRHVGRLLRLDSLLLDKTGITDAGLAQLVALRDLRWLGANDTAITDAGLMHLAGLTQLSSVVTTRTAVTRAGKDALFAAQQANRQAERRQARAAAAAEAGSPAPPPPPPQDPAELAQVTETYLAFAAAMYEWEHAAMAKGSGAVASPNVQAGCRAIFDRFCTVKPRPHSRPDSMHLSDPSDYAPDRQTILGAQLDAPDRAYVYVNVYLFRYRTTLLKRRGRWLIDARQRWSGGWAPEGF